MLKRIVTGLVLAPLFLWALYTLPPVAVSVMMGLIFLAALWEASALIGFSSRPARLIYVLIIGATAVAASILVAQAGNGNWVIAICALAFIWWLIVPVLLHKFTLDMPGIYGTPMGRGTLIAFVLLTAWTAVEALYFGDASKPRMLVNLILLIWVADSAAYFSGKLLGKHKLSPIVSPGKTIEGVVGGLVGSSVVAYLFSRYALGLDVAPTVVWVAMSMVVALLSVWGDLNESALKRVAHIKDSGTVIPGHGGFFDRIDAITAAAPIYVLGWFVFQKGMLT